MADTPDTAQNNNTKSASPGILRVVQSVLAGALGVQSNKRRQEDLSSQSPWPYLIVSVLFTLGFVVTLIFIVKIVLANH
jgi:cytochrome c biogenesis protein CcdA